MKDMISILEKNGYIVRKIDKSEFVLEELFNDISKEDTVGFGGSMTLLELGLFEKLEERGNKVFWHWKSTDRAETLESAKNADIYLSSVNAITEDGLIVNMDGSGNRVSSMIFGHKRVILIIGKNKITKNYKEARERIRNTAAPKNAMRMKINTPCAITGKCCDCSSHQRICKVESIFHKKPNGTEIILYLVDEEMGY